MRYLIKSKPLNGSKRVKTRFLFWPKTINKELRWLEKASWAQKYEVWEDFNYIQSNKWIDQRWID